MRIRIAFFTLLLLITNFLTAQKLTNSDYAEYIKKYKSIAIREMQQYKIPASITLAQGMLESGCGKSTLAMDTKNHFGIKCQKDWTGETYYYDDDSKNECFRKYSNVDDSYRDHSLFLSTRSRYAGLFTLSVTDYKGWALGLKQAGYATNPEYANLLIRLIENNQLYLLDNASYVISDDEAINGPDEEAMRMEKPGDKNEKVPVISEGKVRFRKNYKMPDPSGFEVEYISDMGRKVYLNYDVPFVFARKEDTWSGIAKEFGIFGFQVYKQNDLLESDPIVPGQMLYLENKKKKNSEKKHIVKNGETMYSISQEKCVKLPLLLKYNKLKPGDEPKPGYELKLAR